MRRRRRPRTNNSLDDVLSFARILNFYSADKTDNMYSVSLNPAFVMFSNHETANVRLFRAPLQVPFDMFARPCCSSPVCSGSSLPACVPRRSSSSISRHVSPEQTTATPRMGNSAEIPISRAASPILPCFQSLSPHTDPPPTALARTSGEVDATATSPTLPLLTQNDAHLANQLSTLPIDSLPCGSAALSIVRDSQPPRPNATSFATSTACSPPMSLHVQTSTSPAISAASPAIASLPSPPAAHPTETQHLGCPAGATTGAAAALPFFTKMTLQLHPTCSRSRNTRLHVLHKLRQPPFLIHRRNNAASNRFPALCILFARKPRCLF